MQAAQSIHGAPHLSILLSACVQGAAVMLVGWRMLSFILQQDLHRREVNIANFLEDPRTGRKVCGCPLPLCAPCPVSLFWPGCLPRDVCSGFQVVVGRHTRCQLPQCTTESRNRCREGHVRLAEGCHQFVGAPPCIFDASKHSATSCMAPLLSNVTPAANPRGPRQQSLVTGLQVHPPSIYDEPTKSLSVVIPAYNEQDRLPSSLDSLAG